MKAAMTPTWNALEDRRVHWLQIVGRLEPGIYPATAQPHTAGLSLSCRAVLDSAAEKVEVVGPCLEAEGEIPHRGYWVQGAA